MKKSKLSNFIKQRDDFGSRVELNFDRKGSRYQTKTGGVLSMLIKLLLASLLIAKVI